ncbi:hypothetical protein AOCH_006910 [Aspergillus ochraceoroseus]|uniref:Major facilitator superfamily (MFS) profile domain-containing protein n=1 Tax=Aspergillus ochraceoroseus TaxID=138278 RepID=A0A0F8V0L9_9EURO|nr:hypothetical protein AOCH_006910 [Aspergillus ochraceoroseus]
MTTESSQESTTTTTTTTTHTEDALESRRRALARIDNAPLAGAMPVQSSSPAMLGVVFWENSGSSRPGKVPYSADTAIKVSTSAGTVLGQLLFGWLADRVGRKRMYGIELMIIIVATLGQALAAESRAVSITGQLAFWRVVMGVGIGGDYPLSSVITSEFATTKRRGAMMAAVFAMQGFGQFAAALVALIVTVGFKASLRSATSVSTCTGVCQLAVDKMWRVVIGFGAVPACVALYYRLTIPETPRYTFDVARDILQGDADALAFLEGGSEGHPDAIKRAAVLQSVTVREGLPEASWLDFWSWYSKWKHAKVLLGTAASWFFLDVAFYGLGLNNSIILSAIGWSGGSTVYEYFYRNAVGNLILICAGAIPGYWTTVGLVDILGRKPIQIGGFIILTITFLIIGFAYHALENSDNGLLALYVVSQFFFNFGPNATTFIVPGECFPTRYRSTSHGISAASGKIGAIIAQCVFGPLAHRGASGGLNSQDTPWLNHVMQIFALFMLCGVFTSLLIPETKGKTLEVLAGEDLVSAASDSSLSTPRDEGRQNKSSESET